MGEVASGDVDSLLLEEEGSKLDWPDVVVIVLYFVFVLAVGLFQSQRRVAERESYLKTLPPQHQAMLESYRKHLALQRVCIDHNAEIIKLIIKDVDCMFENVHHQPSDSDDDYVNAQLGPDIEKVQSTIRQIVRDWSPCGEQERSQCYGPVIQQIERLFPKDKIPASVCPTCWLLNEWQEQYSSVKIALATRQVTGMWDKQRKPNDAKCFDETWRILSIKPTQYEDACLYPTGQDTPRNRQDIKILVPGAGLGRLAYELAKRGFSCQGNEFSLFMLFASNFVLNKCRGPNSLRVYPWVHSGNNTLNNYDQLRPSTFPDVDPSDLPPNSEFTMAAGDFLEIYTAEGVFDCVATCFFIDCANNIVAFLETIYKIIKPGGYWVNLGPLLYHFSDQPGESSIEPSYEEVKSIAESIGFKITGEETGVKTVYTQNALSMLKYEYHSVFFAAYKPTSRSG